MSGGHTSGLTLILGNKTYSSWSMRPWLALRQAGARFREVLIPLRQSDSKAQILRYSPSGKVPALVHGDLVIWDSLAICEYVAELYPAARLWPGDRSARAVARSISAEMHSGFVELRSHCSMALHERMALAEVPAGVTADVARIEALWRDARRRFGHGGPFLFGDVTIADAMYAPVCTRIVTYDLPVADDTRTYIQSVLALPAVQEWTEAALAEPWRF